MTFYNVDSLLMRKCLLLRLPLFLGKLRLLISVMYATDSRSQLSHLRVPGGVIPHGRGLSVVFVFGVFSRNTDARFNVGISHLYLISKDLTFNSFFTIIFHPQRSTRLTLMQLITRSLKINNCRLNIIFLQYFISELIRLHFPLFFLFFPSESFLLFSADTVVI